MLTRARSLSRESSLPGDSQSSSQSSLGDSAPQEEVCAPPKKKARRTRPLEPGQWVCLVPSVSARLGVCSSVEMHNACARMRCICACS